LPLYYAVFHGGGAEQWLEDQFGQTFSDVDRFPV
jgi:hypothetical protein